jgi:hypothetical protein
LSVSTSPAACSALASVLKLPAATAVSTMSLALAATAAPAMARPVTMDSSFSVVRFLEKEEELP